MWLLDYVTRNSFSKTEPSIGDVTDYSMGNVAVNSSLEHRNVSVVAPYGITYNPPVGEQSVVLPVDGEFVSLGVVSQGAQNLSEGELRLRSKGGAEIVLKNDGTVVINGKVF